MKQKRLIIDMDNVMADVSQQFQTWYTRETGVVIDPQSLIGVPEPEAFPDKDLLWNFLFTPGFFRTVPVMKDSQKVVAELNKKYDVFIVSSALEFPQSLGEKFAWLGDNFPFIDWKQIVFCGSKAVVKGDYMIDDYLKNLDYFDGYRMLYTAPHNQLLEGHNRVNNWQEVAEVLLN
jgi:5'-nucleotidase